MGAQFMDVHHVLVGGECAVEQGVVTAGRPYAQGVPGLPDRHATTVARDERVHDLRVIRIGVVAPVQSQPVPGRGQRSWLAGLTQLLRREVRFFEEPVRSLILRTGSAPPGQRFLVRPADDLPDDPVTQAAAVAYLSDMFLLAGSLGPRGIVMGDRRLRAVSLDHALWFSPAAHARTWLLHETSTVRSSADRALCRGAIYDLTGTPVADTTQEGLVRITDDTQ